jgi:hypothetical protein
MFGVFMEKSLKRPVLKVLENASSRQGPVLKVLENVWSCHGKVIEETCTKSPSKCLELSWKSP